MVSQSVVGYAVPGLTNADGMQIASDPPPLPPPPSLLFPPFPLPPLPHKAPRVAESCATSRTTPVPPPSAATSANVHTPVPVRIPASPWRSTTNAILRLSILHFPVGEPALRFVVSVPMTAASSLGGITTG